MKKFLAIAAPILLSSASAIALESYVGDYYIRADFGPMNSESFNSSFVSKKVKSDNGVSGSLGVGYHFHENVRAEIVLVGSTPMKHKASGKYANDSNLTAYEEHKVTRYGAQFRFLPDFYDTGYGKIYGVIGVGLNSLKNKASFKLTGSNMSAVVNHKVKRKYAVSLSGGAGVSLFSNDRFLLDATYLYSINGSTKSDNMRIGGNDYRIKSNKLKSHEVKLGIRYYVN